MEFWNSVTKAMLGRTIGGLLLETGKKIWNSYINNPESRFYYRSVASKGVSVFRGLLLLAILKFVVLMYKLRLGRRLGKSAQEGLVVAVATLLVITFSFYFYQAWTRKKQQAEPVLF